MAAARAKYIVQEGCVVYVDGASHWPGQEISLTKAEAAALGDQVSKA